MLCADLKCLNYLGNGNSETFYIYNEKLYTVGTRTLYDLNSQEDYKNLSKNLFIQFYACKCSPFYHLNKKY